MTNQTTSQVRDIAEEIGKFIALNIKDILENKSQPSPLTLEKIENLKKSDKEILELLKEMQEAQKDWMHEVRKEHEKIDGRVKELENWKLVFTTKLTIYSSIAIVAGTAIGNLAVFAFKYAITN